MTSSTIVIKKPQSLDRESVTKPKQPNSALPNIIFMCLWGVSALFAAAKAEINSNASGMSISFTMQDVTLLVFASFLLYKGLVTANIILVTPWIFINCYSIYYGHYYSILRMIQLLQHVKLQHALPWAALSFSSVALIMRVILVMRILQLTAHVWYKNKLEKELYQNL